MMLNVMMEYPIHQRRLLHREANRFYREFADEVRRQTGRIYYKPPPLSDKYRLLRWKGWMDRYKIGLSFLVETLVIYWSKKFESRSPRRKYGIGVRIATLTGDVSQAIIQDQIRREFPQRENEIEWRSRERQKRNQRPVRRFSQSRGFEEILENYREIMEERQKQNDIGYSSGKWTRRRYRNNPFV